MSKIVAGIDIGGTKCTVSMGRLDGEQVVIERLEVDNETLNPKVPKELTRVGTTKSLAGKIKKLRVKQQQPIAQTGPSIGMI